MKNVSSSYSKLPLMEFCIKGSYNSALTGNYINAEMLKYLLSRGCRFFDFEVFYIQDPTSGIYSPQVAYSTDNKFVTIDTKNSILLDNILSTLVANGFSSNISPNSNDPLFINLRIKSNNHDVYSAVAKSVHFAISNKLYPKPVTQNTPIESLMGNIVLSVDKTIDYNYKNFTSCKKNTPTCYDLTKFINIESGSSNMALNRYKNILSQNNISLQIQNDNLYTNIKKLTNYINLVLPDVLPENAANPDIEDFIMNYACQIVPFKFYQLDNGLNKYETFFNDNNAGIVPLSAAIIYYNNKSQKNM
jgi:hypothetical protein